MNIGDFFKELTTRWSAEKPKFFKTLQQIGLWTAFISSIPATMAASGINIGSIPEIISQIFVVSGFVSAIIAQFTATTAEKLSLKLYDD